MEARADTNIEIAGIVRYDIKAKENTMPMSMNERVEECILRTIGRFKGNPELFLTESDLKCRLFMELNNDPVFSQEKDTQDGEKRTNYVHSETSYFVSGKLNQKRVDITVVRPSNYDFKNEEVVYRKGYCFAEPSIGIELKLNKNKSKKGVEDKLKADLDNLKKLKNNRPESSFYELLIDKRKVFSETEINALKNEYPEIRIFYGAVDQH
jgi:hypothetical protein